VYKADAEPADQVTPETFFNVDIRLGQIVSAEDFPEARKPAYKVQVDFGPGVGVRKSSAQITTHYSPDDLIGRRVLGVVNFPPRQIGPVRSEVLILGVYDGAVYLLNADGDAPLGSRVG
jgi:tRNA-binding protein